MARSLGREAFLYLFFGVLTTGVNLAAYRLLTRAGGVPYLWASALAWAVSVLFAYLTNRRFVFGSRARGRQAVGRELLAFIGGRAATGGMDLGLMYVGVAVLRWDDFLVKVLANGLVIVANYGLSKWWVFRPGRPGK